MSNASINAGTQAASFQDRMPGNYKVVFLKAGGTDQIALITEPEPIPAQGEVKVRVLAAGVAYADILTRRGVAGGKFPLTPGFDVVGVVDMLGEGATGFNIGDRVAALTGTGGQQQFICIAEDELVEVPTNVQSEQAVCVILNYLTAYQLLTRSAALKQGDTAFIYGLAGGIGSAMQQIAKQLGIGLYGTASRNRLQSAQRDGAVAFDRDDSDWVHLFHKAVPGGVNAVFDAIGGASLNRSYGLLAPGGTLVMLGAASAVQGKGKPYLKILGTVLRFVMIKLRPDARRARIYVVEKAKRSRPREFKEDIATLLGWLGQGRINPVIEVVLPLSQVRQAHERLEAADVSGKIVLQP